MSRNHDHKKLIILLTTTLSVWAIGSVDALAQAISHVHEDNARPVQRSGPHADEHRVSEDSGGAPFLLRAPHGGQLTVAGSFRFEVVYRTQETRVYLYDADQRPISTRGVLGQAAMKVRSHDKVYRHPLSHVAFKDRAQSHDYLTLAADVSRIKAGDMSVTFELTDLPNPQQPQVTFTQTFVLSKMQDQATWTCSMHPQIKSPKPGKCPICGMDLVRAKESSLASDKPGPSNSHASHESGSGGSHSSHSSGSGTSQKSKCKHCKR